MGKRKILIIGGIIIALLIWHYLQGLIWYYLQGPRITPISIEGNSEGLIFNRLDKNGWSVFIGYFNGTQKKLSDGRVRAVFSGKILLEVVNPLTYVNPSAYTTDYFIIDLKTGNSKKVFTCKYAQRIVISPDESKVAFTEWKEGETWKVYLVDLEKNIQTEIGEGKVGRIQWAGNALIFTDSPGKDEEARFFINGTEVKGFLLDVSKEIVFYEKLYPEKAFVFLNLKNFTEKEVKVMRSTGGKEGILKITDEGILYVKEGEISLSKDGKDIKLPIENFPLECRLAYYSPVRDLLFSPDGKKVAITFYAENFFYIVDLENFTYKKIDLPAKPQDLKSVFWEGNKIILNFEHFYDYRKCNYDIWVYNPENEEMKLLFPEAELVGPL
jgi:dipeptidyl aminopeptidase/acylaminoacyl peptidase